MLTTAAPKSIASPTESLSYQHLDILHALRGFCAFYVVLFHARYILWVGGRQYIEAFPASTWKAAEYGLFLLDILSSAGYEMVLFFFVLSGFFIRHSQLRRQRTAIDFYLNRIARIYPPFLSSIILAVFTLYFLSYYAPEIFIENGRELNHSLIGSWNEVQNLSLSSVAKIISFLPINNYFIGYNMVYWSLLPEALFYLCVPFALRVPRLYYILSVIVYITGFFFNKDFVQSSPLVSYAIEHNIYFALGVALYDIIIRTNWLKYVQGIPTWLVCALLIALSTALVGTSILKWKSLSSLFSAILAIAAISFLLAGKLVRTNYIIRIFYFIGTYSFSLYLYHFPLLLLAYGIVAKITGKIIIYNHIYFFIFPVVTIVCYGLYWTTERLAVYYFRK